MSAVDKVMLPEAYDLSTETAMETISQVGNRPSNVSYCF